MKYIGILLIISGMAFTSCNSGTSVAEPEMTAEIDTFSYYYGVLVGKNLQSDILKNNPNANMDALKYGLLRSFDDEMDVDRAEMEAFVDNIMKRDGAKKEKEQRQKQAAQAQVMLNQYKENVGEYKDKIDELEAWIKANRNFDEVTKAPEGYFYRVIKQGEGNKPGIVDEVEVHYTGTLLDGTKFDSSVDRGEPIKFPLLRVIPGWTLGVQNMAVGSTFEFFFPAHLAYGENGTGSIPPNSPLVFEVQLLGITGQ